MKQIKLDGNFSKAKEEKLNKILDKINKFGKESLANHEINFMNNIEHKDFLDKLEEDKNN